ncbi:MAG: hypothetical protein IJA72_00975 [Clostridia bacterium]|nr:hypothetical protein [Clostridia bacterium]
MKQPNLITSIINKYNEHSDSKPKFNCNNLYIGRIVMLHKIDYKQNDVAGIQRRNRVTPIKKFAIFYKKNTPYYLHIKTGKQLKRVEDSAECEFAIDNLCPLSIIFSNPLRSENIETKFSKKQICDIETEQNQQCGIIPNTEHLFGV